MAEPSSKSLDPRLRRLVHEMEGGRTRELNRDLERGAVAADAADLPAMPLEEALYKRVLVKLATEEVPPQALDLEWVRIAGDIFGVRVPLLRLQELADLPEVQFVSGGHVVTPDLDGSRSEVRADVVHGPPASLSGRGVAVGIVDYGCDYVLDDFRDPATGRTRIAFLWDQSLRPLPGEGSPDGFAYGVEYTAADIDAALAGGGGVRHRSGVSAHGTHVMGIAAGSGRSFDAAFPAGQFIGMAPEATLIFVQPATSPGDPTFTDSVHVAEALAYVFARASDLGLPCVVNMSLGQNGGSHDGESLVERVIDRLLEEPGRALVVAGGNEHVWQTHAAGSLTTGQVRTLRWRAGGPAPIPGFAARPDRTPNELEIWYSSRDLFDVRVISPGGQATPLVQPGDPPANHLLPGGNEVYLDSERFTVMNGDARIYIQVSPGTANTVASGTWRVEITAREARDGAFDAWIERDVRDRAQDFADQSYFEGADFAPVKTLGTPATTRRVIAVANYRHALPQAISASSGRGPTRDGRLKPEVAAPGTNIRSSCSAGGRPNPLPPGGLHPMRVPMSGTSQASPHVAGIVALMLERNPQLTSAQIARVLVATTRPAPGGGPGFDEAFGFGLVDAEAAIDAVP
jgi:subtilisin family serine protease